MWVSQKVSMNSPSISRAHSWNSIWKCLLTQTSLFQSSFVQAEMCSFLILCQRKIRIKLAHTLSSSKVVHYWKRSFFILLHKLVLANLMYWCCYFKHGIGLSYFRKNDHCPGLGVSQGRESALTVGGVIDGILSSLIISVGRTALGF